MLEKAEIAKGLALLSTAFNRVLTPEVVRLYREVISPKLDAQQWERAVKRALEAESFFPPPAVLLRYGAADGSPRARALEFYDRIIRHYESGDELGPREVRERYGDAAMDAFVAAGGSRAFSWCEPKDEPFRRRDFANAWVEVVEQEPKAALAAGVEPLRLGE